MKKTIQAFNEDKQVAIVGASPNKENFGRYLINELVKKEMGSSIEEINIHSMIQSQLFIDIFQKHYIICLLNHPVFMENFTREKINLIKNQTSAFLQTHQHICEI